MAEKFLAECEREPLNRSGLIQPHGALLGVDPLGYVTYASANLASILGEVPEALLGRPLPEELHEVVAALGEQPGSRQKHLLTNRKGKRDFMVLAHRSPHDAVILEWWPSLPWTEPHPVLLPQRLEDDTAVAAARQELVETIRSATGFERVLYYAFLANGDGEVLAESRDPSAYGSYLGLRFPASDIPQIARHLYRQNPWRLIPNAKASAIPLVGVNPTSLDLTYSLLRSVSPVHQAYLANMGVVASLSFPLVINGQLVALIAAHHREERLLPVEMLDNLAARVQNFARSLAAYQSHQRLQFLDTLDQKLEPIRRILRRHGELFSAWSDLAPHLTQVVWADGVTLCLDGEVAVHGVALSKEALAVVDQWFCQQDEVVWSTDSLVRAIPKLPLTEVAGVAALRTHVRRLKLRLYFCRSQWIHEVAWGGNPEKPMEYSEGGLPISPRRSFEKWIETRLGYSRPWENEELLVVLRIRALLQSMV